jgi:hypothetical protein
MTIIGGEVSDISRFKIFINNTGGLVIHDLNLNGVLVPNVFNLDELCFIVITYFNGNIKVYKNKVLIYSEPYNASSFLIKNFSLGSLLQTTRSDSVEQFNGILDDLSIWSRFLTQDDVNELYESYTVKKLNVKLIDGLMGLYKFKDTDGINNIKDYSGRGKNLIYDGPLGMYSFQSGGLELGVFGPSQTYSDLKNNEFDFIQNDMNRIGEVTVSCFISYYPTRNNNSLNILNLFGNFISIKTDVRNGSTSWDYMVYCNGIFVYKIEAEFTGTFGQHVCIKLNRLTRTATIIHNNKEVHTTALPDFSIVNDQLIIGDIINGNDIMSIDCLGIWNRGLNEMEISSLYNDGNRFENFGVDITPPDEDGYGYSGGIGNGIAKFKSNILIKNNIKIRPS